MLASPAGIGEARGAAEKAARLSYGKLVAYLAAPTRDVAGAEDALAEAFASALSHWPRTGVPANPEAWLLTAARRRMIDAARRRKTDDTHAGHLRLLADEAESAMPDSDIPDERLRLMFACAHPAIDPAVRAPLMLQAVLGFDAAAIASAFLVSPAAMSQRLVRAKTRIREAGIPFKVPEPAEFGERLDAVLEAIYAAYAEGWSDPAGTDAQRRDLAGEGIWLGRVAVSLLPDEPEALGLLALMLYAESRRRARRGADGSYVPLAEQDMSHWDDAIIDEAEELLSRAGTMGRIGRYQLEAAVQSAHAARRMGGHADWAAIRQLYDGLLLVSGSPVAAINRAVAIAETDGPQAGLAALDEAGADGRLAAYQPYFAARAALLARLGQPAEAAAAYDRAMGLERDPAVRHFLRQRRDRLAV
jgi:RNA polymerase sigma-70 factor (ECF subfamily)